MCIRDSPLGNLSLGVRYEHVTFDYYKDGVHMDEQSRMYGNWFPNLSFSRKLGSVRAQLSYTAKTQRPTYSQLSNNVTYVDLVSYTHLYPQGPSIMVFTHSENE